MPGGRTFSVEITGTFVATVTLQRSSGNENDYQDWRTYTAPITESIYDAQDNQVWYYRLIVKPGHYTSGTVNMTLRFQGGTTTGYVRVIEYTSPTSVTAEVIKGRELSSTQATKVWYKGAWSATSGFPSVVTRGYGRLWYGRRSTLFASQSDNFMSFEPGSEADKAISYSIGSSADDSVRWLSMLNVLCVGTTTGEFIGVARTNSEPVGPSNFQLLDASSEGGAAIRPVTAGNSILYVHKSLRRIMQFTQNPKALSETAYISVDLTARAPELFDSNIAGIAMQGDPERRIYAWSKTGRLYELLFRREADLDVVAWADVITDGRVECVSVIPETEQDRVYFCTRRKTYSGSWRRAIERYTDERYQSPDEFGHLDAAVRLLLTKPDTVATPSGTSGVITITTDDDVFATSDIGATIWINGGRGVITDRPSASSVTVSISTELLSDKPASGGRWGYGQAMTTITGLDHLNGQTVRIYGDRKDLGTAVVSDGEVELPEACSTAIVGLPVRSRWKSLKLAYGAQKGSALTMPKAIKRIGLLLHQSGPGITFGPSFEKQWPIKIRSDEAWNEPVRLFSGEKEVTFDGGFDPDPRLCIEVNGPDPATVAGYVPSIDERDR